MARHLQEDDEESTEDEEDHGDSNDDHEDEDDAETFSNSTSIASDEDIPSLTEIRNYQLILWISIGLILTLLSSIGMLASMPIEADSLLYAKFRSPSGRKND